MSFADGRSESPGESLTRIALVEALLPLPELQVEFRRGDGSLVARPDFTYREQRTVVEFDGMRKYRSDVPEGDDAGEVVWREKKREDALRELFGVEVVRVTWADLHDRRREELGRRVRAAFARASQRRPQAA